MFVIGHVGITAFVARKLDRKIDLKWPMILAILPDAVDKPVRYLVPNLVSHNTRNFCHTLLAALVVLSVFAALRRRVYRPFLLAACWAGHLVLDRLWLYNNPEVLLWPLLGPFPPPIRTGALFNETFIYNLCGEAVGLAAVFYLWRRRLLRPQP